MQENISEVVGVVGDQVGGQRLKEHKLGVGAFQRRDAAGQIAPRAVTGDADAGGQSGGALVLTDSGGLQEEAPVLGLPVLVLRQLTERPEGVAAGSARVIGIDPEAIVAAAAQLLDRPAAREQMARVASPYGDGQAAPRILAALLESSP